MKDKDLLSAMSFVGEDLIQEAEQKSNKLHHRRRAAGLIAAAALALVMMALPISSPDIVPDESEIVEIPQDIDKLQINWLETAASAEADMDLLQETRYDAKIDGYRWPEWSPAPLQEDLPLIHLPNQPMTDELTVPAQFAQAAGVSSNDFYPELQERFTISSYYILWVRSSRESETYDLAHDHCLELSTERGGMATVSVSWEGWPLRCCLILDENPLLSTVEGVEMAIHGMNLADGKTFFTRFETEGIWYDIETSGISEDELQFLLETLLRCREIENAAPNCPAATEVCGYPSAPESSN